MNIDKMQKLLAMTASSQQEEARTAAFMLCKMLREGNADLSRLTTRQSMHARVTSDVWPKSDAAKRREQEERVARENERARWREVHEEYERQRRQRQHEREQREAAAKERARKIDAFWEKEKREAEAKEQLRKAQAQWQKKVRENRAAGGDAFDEWFNSL